MACGREQRIRATEPCLTFMLSSTLPQAEQVHHKTATSYVLLHLGVSYTELAIVQGALWFV